MSTSNSFRQSNLSVLCTTPKSIEVAQDKIPLSLQPFSNSDFIICFFGTLGKSYFKLIGNLHQFLFCEINNFVEARVGLKLADKLYFVLFDLIELFKLMPTCDQKHQGYLYIYFFNKTTEN